VDPESLRSAALDRLLGAPDSRHLHPDPIFREHHDLGRTELDAHRALDEIPLVGRIVAIADVFDALTSSRPYKQAWTYDAAFANLQEEAGNIYDPVCVEAFVSIRDRVIEVAEKVTH
jgi:putative two-component system response regulator